MCETKLVTWELGITTTRFNKDGKETLCLTDNGMTSTYECDKYEIVFDGDVLRYMQVTINYYNELWHFDDSGRVERISNFYNLQLHGSFFYRYTSDTVRVLNFDKGVKQGEELKVDKYGAERRLYFYNGIDITSDINAIGPLTEYDRIDIKLRYGSSFKFVDEHNLDPYFYR